tara:strand:+ start:234 stop:512 length:279 start_codon:yes stop_codon:yes gene_type:complete
MAINNFEGDDFLFIYKTKHFYTYLSFFCCELFKKRRPIRMTLTLEQLTLAIIVGTLAAIVYALRVLVILERRIARMDGNMMKIVQSMRGKKK